MPNTRGRVRNTRGRIRNTRGRIRNTRGLIQQQNFDRIIVCCANLHTSGILEPSKSHNWSKNDNSDTSDMILTQHTKRWGQVASGIELLLLYTRPFSYQSSSCHETPHKTFLTLAGSLHFVTLADGFDSRTYTEA